MTSDCPVMPGAIVLGSPRSGTTLLRRLLGSHPEISCPGETFLFRGCARFIEHDTISGGFDYGVLGALEGLGYEREDVLARLRRFATGFYEEIAKKEGKSMWIAKTAVDSFYMPQIEKLFAGHAKFICVLRHGLDVVCSMDEFSRDLQSYISELHSYIQEYPQPHEAFAHAWCDVTEDILDFAERYKDQCHIVKYEDLTAAPDDELQKLTDFLGVSPHNKQAGDILQKQTVGGIGDWKSFKKTSIEKSSIGRWQALSDSTVEQLAAICNPTLNRAGYDPIEADDEDAKRRKEIAAMMMRAKQE